MSSTMGTIFAPGSSPPWLPRDVAEGRRFAWWAAIMFLLWVLIWFVIAIAAMVVWVVDDGQGPGMLLLSLIGFIAMVVCFMSAIFMKKTVLDAIDQGRFHDAKNDSMVWILFGFAAFALPSILLILTYVKLGDAITAHAPVGYMPYQQGAVTAQTPQTAHPHAPPPAPVQQAPPQQAPPAQHPQYHGHATPMLRCKNCNVQFPTFMHTCPNCGKPKE
ncbi:TPA: hypothetical protein HA259_03535 [Thermoplasmata archaeon]|nr:hypothetical protein [Thermoplasmata archaeon]